jgi:hypothetical protein
MSPLKSLALAAFCFACALQEDPVCSHPDCGDSRAVSLETVARAQGDIKQRLALSWDRSLRVSADQPFDSGLPSCGARRTRRIPTRLPPELVGKTLAFAPADRMFQADVRVATSAKRLLDVRADALADRALVERLDLRCAPTMVRCISEVELELLENP